MADFLTNAERRFGGIARLYGDAGLAKLQQAHVCVIGIGGVGSWAVESLARTAIGAITMIELDVVAESNINRQLPALEKHIGKDKTAVMRERIEQINPDCKVSIIDDFITPQNQQQLITDKFDFVIDCIDDFRTKAALISHCKNNKINIVTLGGAGGQIDPSKIKTTDLSRSQHDVLLAKTRKLLRQDFGFARNPKRSFGIKCVYSDEQLRYPDGEGGLSPQRPPVDPDNSQGNALNCAGGLGSVTHVTASFGMVASAYVINEVANAD